MSGDNHLRGPSVRGVPEGDNRERMICAECGFVLYDNPKIVVGSVPRWGDRILMCRRAIHPQRGCMLDFLDYPLNNRFWLEDEFEKVLTLPTLEARWARLDEIRNWMGACRSKLSA